METTTPNPKITVTKDTIINPPGYKVTIEEYLERVNYHLKDLVPLFNYEPPITGVHITRKDKLYFEFTLEPKGWEEDKDINGIILSFLQALSEKLKEIIETAEEEELEIENLWDNLFKVHLSDNGNRLYITISFPI